MSLSGIGNATENSEFGSYIFVFTDATAKDYDKVDKIKYLCQKKQIQVIFILTGDCKQSSSKGYSVYYEIAQATSGQVFRVKINEVNGVLNVIHDLLQDKKAVIAWKILKPSLYYQKVEFEIDVKSTSVMVSSSSWDLDLHITNTPSLLFGEKEALQKIMWTSNAKVGNLVHPRPGKYYAWVRGSSLIPFVVYVSTHFAFEHGFSTEETALSLEYTSKQPFDNSGISQHLYIQTTDDSVEIQIVSLIDMSGKDLIKLQAKKIGINFYVTPSFTVPASMFSIKVIGFTKPDNKLVVRASKTPIDPSSNVSVKSLPKIHVIETQRNFSYGETAVFTCKVESYTKPYVEWTDERGYIWENMVTQISASDYYIRLKVSQIKKSSKFTCSAKNSEGVTKVNINLEVPSLFHVRRRPESKTKVPFGMAKTIICDVLSSRAIEIKWYRQNSVSKSIKPVVTSDKLSISSNGTKLIINSMDLELSGNYTCVASLVSDPSEQISLNTEVLVTGLEKPEIVEAHSAIIENRFWAICRVNGVPKPSITWQFKPKGSGKFHTISKSGEELNIPELTSENSGIYRCVTKNALGLAELEFKPIEVNPEIQPEVDITEGDKIIANYDSAIILTCTVKAYPKPEISWYSSEGIILLPFKTSSGNSTQHFSQLRLTAKNNATYTCKGKNTKGSSVKDVRVELRPVFKTMPSPAGTIKYGEPVNVTCNIQSDYPMNITWYKFGKELIDEDVYNVSANRTVLTIKTMALESQGNYTCRAYLIADPTIRVEHTTKVEIYGMEPPVIISSKRSINILKGDKIDLKCQIVKGYPHPQVSWYKKNEHFQQIINKTEEVITVGEALSDAGQYECRAENVMGNDYAAFDVFVRNYPEIAVEKTKTNFSYGCEAEFVCKVESHVEPAIQWTDEEGAILEDKVTQISKFNYVSRLKIDKVKKSTVYTCAAGNDVGVSEADVAIRVSSPFEVKKDSEISSPYGEQKAILCEIKSSEPFTIKWYRFDGDLSTRAELVPSDNLSISTDGTKLIINRMDLDFKGKYACEATLVSDLREKITYNINVNITGLVFPEIVSSSTSETDKNFTAICRVKGVPKPVISWHFKPRGSVAYRLIPGSGEELNIPTVRRGHAGVYKCVARNILGENHRIIDVVILEVPVIMNEINKFIALKGDAVLRIPCKATGWPEPRVVWKKDGLIIKNSSKYEVKQNILFVKNLMETDTANYTCEAINVLGTAHKTSEIIVTDAFKNYNNDALNGHTHTIIAITKSPVTITCKVKNSDILQTRWYLNGQYTNYTGSAYNIAKATKEDSGIYTCRVNSNEGSSSQSFDLQIGSPPHFVYDSWSVDADIEDVLDCTVTFDPEVEVQWLHNGVLMSTGNYTQEFVAHEWGEYKCIASNKYGSIERTYKIESTDCYVNKHMVTQNMPLWFYDKKVWPKLSYNVGIILAASESIVLVCPSPNTFQEFPTKNNITAECYKEDQFIVDGKTYKFSTLQCKEKIEPLIVNTNKKCAGPHTEMIQIGFTVGSFMEAYKVCYDSKNNVPVFGSTQIVTKDISREQMLFKWSQTKTEHDTGELACRNFSNCCYSNSQLITAEQMVFGPPQAATFKNNLNSVPVWIPCDSEERMSWKTFEGNVRYWSSKAIDFKSWTGASYYVNKTGGRIPKLLWKVIDNKGEFTAAVYVNSMDPTTDDVLCSSSCESLQMLELESESAANSFYCCSLNEFSKAFNITYSFNNDAPFLLTSSS